MYKVIAVFIAILVVSSSAFAQGAAAAGEKVTVTNIQMPADSDTGMISGKLSDGQKLSSLRWAENSSVACFPGTRFEQFDGSHVFYRVTLPAASSMKIVLKPEDGKKINLYALRQSARGDQPVPPNVSRAISCEASYPIYANVSATRRVQNEDTGRKVEYISVNSPYSILIGVAGAEGLTEGSFDLYIEIKPR